MMEFTREEFEAAVSDALDLIPPELTDLMDNVVVLVEDDAPSWDPELLGLYDGVPLTERGEFWAAGALPDRITIFRNPTVEFCQPDDEEIAAHADDPDPNALRACFGEAIREEILTTVVHEIAHHFGIDDDRLHELGWG